MDQHGNCCNHIHKQYCCHCWHYCICCHNWYCCRCGEIGGMGQWYPSPIYPYYPMTSGAGTSSNTYFMDSSSLSTNCEHPHVEVKNDPKS